MLNNTISYGYCATSTGGAPGGLALTSAAHKQAFGFYLPKAATISKIRIYQGAGGTAVPMMWSILAEFVDGIEGAVEVSETSFSSTGSSTVTELTINASLLAGRHWLVLRNTTTTSVTYYAVTADWAAIGRGLWGRRQDAAVGNWRTGAVYQACGLTIELSTGEVTGFNIVNGSYSGDANFKMYSGYESGTVMLSPSDVFLRVVGVSAMLYQVGTSGQGNLYCNLYCNGSKIATSTPTPSVNMGASGYTLQSTAFPSPVCIPPDSKLNVMLTTDAGSSAVYLRSAVTVADINGGDSRWLALRPCSGSMYLCSNIGGAWTFSGSKIPHIALLLDESKPFYTPPINRRTSTGR